MTDESACVSEGVGEEDSGTAKTELQQTFTWALFYFFVEVSKGKL